MADLIFTNPETTDTSLPGYENDYEFDPANREAIQRIHLLLSLRKHPRVQNTGKLLGLYCNKTLQKDSDSEIERVEVLLS